MWLCRIILLRKDGRQSIPEFRGRRVEDLAHHFECEDVSHFLIWEYKPSAEEKHKYRRELALASRNIPYSVEAVMKSLTSVGAKLHIACAEIFHRKSTPYISMIICALSAWVGCDATAIPAVVGRTLYLGNMPMVDRAIVTTLAAYDVVASLEYCHRSRQSHTKAHPSNSCLANLLSMNRLRRASGGNAILRRWHLLKKT
ncbi:hypothetical protein BDR22DRAFT_321148 [Usnea florida]